MVAPAVTTRIDFVTTVELTPGVVERQAAQAGVSVDAATTALAELISQRIAEAVHAIDGVSVVPPATTRH